jgi:hypothetical protein
MENKFVKEKIQKKKKESDHFDIILIGGIAVDIVSFINNKINNTSNIGSIQISCGGKI